MKFPRHPGEYETNWKAPMEDWMNAVEEHIRWCRWLSLFAAGFIGASILFQLVEWLSQ